MGLTLRAVTQAVRIDKNGSPLAGEDVTFKIGLGLNSKRLDTYINSVTEVHQQLRGFDQSDCGPRVTDLQRDLHIFDHNIPTMRIINSATLQMQSTQIGGTLIFSAVVPS